MGWTSEGAPLAKRTQPRRGGAASTSGSSQAANSVVIAAAVTSSSSLAGEPKWFASTLEMVQKDVEGLGPRWMELVAVWAAFEKQHGYAGPSKLASTNRPGAVAAWIQRARSPQFRPIIKDLVAYEAGYIAWWAALQPDWRVVHDHVVQDKVEGDWAVLRKPGANGIVSIMVALFYWGLQAQKDKDHQKQWSLAVDDCYAAFSKL
jgi:hypothetical protein